MSYSALIVFRNGLAEADAEYRNSHGTVTVVWDALLKKYEELIYSEEEIKQFRFEPWMRAGCNGGYEKLWDVHKATPLPLRPWEWIALQWSYDNALVRAADLLVVGEALERFQDAHVVTSRRVCHLKAIGERMRELQRGRIEGKDVDAVGLYATSVGDNPWMHYNEDDELVPYDLNKDTKHWFVDVAV